MANTPLPFMANSLSTQDKKLSKNISITFELSPADNNRLANLCGAIDDNLKTIERRMGVEISYRSHEFKVTGKSLHCEAVKKL